MLSHMQKPSPLQISLGVSVLVHALVLGVYGIGEFNASQPTLQQEDNLITLNLVAAPKEPAAPSPVVKAIAPVQPLPPKEPPPVSSEPVQAPPTEPPLVAATSNLVVAVLKPVVQPSFQGDASSPQPGQDATTEQARPGVEAKPNYLRNPEPIYPASARRRHQQGVVLLAVTVTAQGRPARVEIETSSGYPLLDNAAEEAVRAWEFEPARIGSLALESKIEVPIRFQLTPQ